MSLCHCKFFYQKSLALSAANVLRTGFETTSKLKNQLQTWGFCIDHIINKVNKGLLRRRFFKKTLDMASPGLLKFFKFRWIPVYLMEGGDAGEAHKNVTHGNY